MLILPGRTCNAIYRNSDEAYVFYGAYFFNRRPRASVCQIDLELQLVLRKQLPIPFQKNTNLFTRIPLSPRPNIWHFLSQNTVHLQLNMLRFFWPIFLMVFQTPSNMSKDRLSFLDHLGICFKVPDPQFTFQWWKQWEITQHEVWAVWWMLLHFSIVALKPLLHKSSHMQLNIVSMKNPPLKKLWSFPPDIIKEFFQYHLVIFFTYPYFWRTDILIDHPSAIEESGQHHFAPNFY